MSVTADQVANEKRKEQQFNALSKTVISKTPFGAWYGLMRGAASALQSKLKQSVGIDEDGRPLVVYSTDVGKLIGVWSTPTHEFVTKYASQGEYWKAAASLFGIYGQAQALKQQKKAKFFNISPDEVGEMYQKSLVKKNVTSEKNNISTNNMVTTSNNKAKEGVLSSQKIDADKKGSSSIIIWSAVGLTAAVIISIIIYKIKHKK